MTLRSGRPLLAFSEDDVTAVKHLLDEDARYTVDEISESLSINSSAGLLNVFYTHYFLMLEELYTLHCTKIVKYWETFYRCHMTLIQ